MKVMRFCVFCVPVALLFGAAVMVALAFPSVAKWALEVEAPMVGRYWPALGWILGGVCCVGVMQWVLFRELRRKLWIAGCFHLGVLAIVVGGGLTAVCARTEVLPMASPVSEAMVRVGENRWEPLASYGVEPHVLSEWRMVFLQGRWVALYPHTWNYFMPADFKHWLVAGLWSPSLAEPLMPGAGAMPGYEPVALESFVTEHYANGMPSQYRTRLRFGEDEVRELSVNAPLRRKGLTYYQMSAYERAIPAVDAMGNPVYYKQLALDEARRPQFDPSGQPRYLGEQGEYPVEYRMAFTELAVRSDPGAPIVFVGYGLLILAAAGMAVREERRK